MHIHSLFDLRVVTKAVSYILLKTQKYYIIILHFKWQNTIDGFSSLFFFSFEIFIRSAIVTCILKFLQLNLDETVTTSGIS